MREHGALSEMLWKRAAIVPGMDSDVWRVDHMGRLMNYLYLRDFDSPFGWALCPLEDNTVTGAAIDDSRMVAANVRTVQEAAGGKTP